jgi:hypothetical protein
MIDQMVERAQQIAADRGSALEIGAAQEGVELSLPVK